MNAIADLPAGRNVDTMPNGGTPLFPKRNAPFFRILFLFLIIFNPLYAKGENNEDYTVYHQYINKAEDCFYTHNQVDSCLHYYNLAFEGFSFNYVHDLVNAAQIAYFSEKEYKSYLYKAYNYGLQAKHLKQIPLFKPDCIDEFENFEQTASYQKIRNNYLKSINIEYLDWIYDFAIEEQVKKEQDDFVLWWDAHIKELTAKINQYGFPANQIIGIENNTIFAEFGMPDKDMFERVSKHKDKDILCDENMPDFFLIGNDTIQIEKEDNIIQCFNVDENILGISLIMYGLIHYGISNASNDTIYNQLQTIWLQEVRKGNLHPREMALLHDNIHRIIIRESSDEFFESSQRGVGEVFGIETDFIHLTYDESFDVNEFRAKYNIVSLAIDAKKKEYEKKYGFKLFWGFWKCL